MLACIISVTVCKYGCVIDYCTGQKFGHSTILLVF